jgi:Protein of unknown function (DUF2914)
MEGKKNIVIKVRYPASGKKAVYDVSSASKVKTEWNIKRILLALAGVVMIIVVFFFLKHDTQKTDLQSKAALQPKATSPEKIVNTPIINTPVKPKIELNNNIIRALLTFKINNNEPVGEIILPLKLGKNKSTSVYYFVELTAMKGRTVYHEWLLDGKLITRKKVNISNDNWRTSSRQLFAYTAKANWTVRLVDETGQLLNEIHFNIIYE